MKFEKNVRMQNCLFQQDLKILSDIVSDEMYIFHFNLKKIRSNSIFQTKYLTNEKNVEMENYSPE